jgi:hypothetical protein
MKLQWRVKEAIMPVAIIGAGAVGATLVKLGSSMARM